MSLGSKRDMNLITRTGWDQKTICNRRGALASITLTGEALQVSCLTYSAPSSNLDGLKSAALIRDSTETPPCCKRGLERALNQASNFIFIHDRDRRPFRACILLVKLLGVLPCHRGHTFDHNTYPLGVSNGECKANSTLEELMVVPLDDHEMKYICLSREAYILYDLPGGMHS